MIRIPTPGAGRASSTSTPNRKAPGWTEQSTRTGNGRKTQNEAQRGFHVARNDDRDDRHRQPDVDCAADLYDFAADVARGRAASGPVHAALADLAVHTLQAQSPALPPRTHTRQRSQT